MRRRRRLVGWSFVRALTVSDSTICETGPIVRLRRGRADSIRKLKDGAPLDHNYIRPYVPCSCPSFVTRTLGKTRVLLGEDAEPGASGWTQATAPSVPLRDAKPVARQARAPGEAPLLAFSWGYEGWGNHTPSS